MTLKHCMTFDNNKPNNYQICSLSMFI